MEVLSRTTGHIVCVTDKDSVIAVAGAPRRELMDKPVSGDMERVMDSRTAYTENGTDMQIIEGETAYTVGVAVPIITEGDTVGSVAILRDEKAAPMGEVETKLAGVAAGFIGKHMEN